MGIKTEEMVAYLPPKEITENVDWLGILDSFDPASLYDRYINECARRNPFDTCYKRETPVMPVEERIKHSESGANFDRRNLEGWVKRIEDEGLTSLTYKNARAALIKAIGSKGAVEYNRREYERLGETGRKNQEEEYRRWEQKCQERRAQEEELDEYYYGYYDLPDASVHEKVVRVRKGYRGTNGKPLIQRDFAKLIDYPINKYAEAEKTDRYGRGDEESPVEYELLEKLVMIAHANPYWLFDPECEASFAEDSYNSEIVRMGDEPCVYAAPDVILKWIKEGKPTSTHWEDSVIWDIEW